MANGKMGEKIIGSFTEKDHGNHFEFKEVECPMWKQQGCTHEVAVGGAHGCHYRGAIVKKTVAYIAIDEGTHGEAIWEKWQIKKRFDFEAF